MSIVVFLVVAGIFLLLTLVRVGGARRKILLERWPAVLLGVGAGLALARGSVWPALGLAGAAILMWVFVPSQVQTNSAAQRPAPVDPKDAEARAILGVGPTATAAEIRAAYRAKMAQAHPDAGGAHAEATRFTAARDQLLKR